MDKKENQPKKMIFKSGHSELSFGPVNEHGKLMVANNFGGLECRYYFSPADVFALRTFLMEQQPQHGPTNDDELIHPVKGANNANCADCGKLYADLPTKPCKVPGCFRNRMAKEIEQQSRINGVPGTGSTCFRACGPGDFGPGGKCEKMGCRKKDSGTGTDGNKDINQ